MFKTVNHLVPEYLVHVTWSWRDSTELKRCVDIGFAAKCLERAVLTINEYKWVRQVKCDSKKAICNCMQQNYRLNNDG